jgi:hypothetical protein
MKEIKQHKYKNPLKKLFIKLCRLLGYEIIDQSNFSVPTLDKKINENLSNFNHKSITLPLGELKITRKVLSLDIIIKTCTSVNLVTQNKKRIFEKNKSEYTFRTINSLINSVNFTRETIPNINVNITIIDHNSKNEDLNIIKNTLNNFDINSKIINLDVSKYQKKITVRSKNNLVIESNMKSTMASINKSFDLATKPDVDLVYFVEDDYIHKKDAVLEMLYTYEKISTIYNDELFLCPIDYPYLYKPSKQSEIVLGHNKHWRSVNESLLTFMASRQMLIKHIDKLNYMSLNEHSPFESPLHKIYENELCLSPIPSLALHCTNVNSVFGLSPNIDWKEIWEDAEIKN